MFNLQKKENKKIEWSNITFHKDRLLERYTDTKIKKDGSSFKVDKIKIAISEKYRVWIDTAHIQADEYLNFVVVGFINEKKYYIYKEGDSKNGNELTGKEIYETLISNLEKEEENGK